jgi:hypothetical protein
VDVYTEEDFGVAYVYWTHLLQPVRQNMHFIPAENRIGGCTVYWLKWYSKFFEPFSSILSKLSAGTARGHVCFEDRKRLAADRTIVARQLSSYDFFVIRKVDVQQQDRYIASIKEKTEESDGPWKKIIHNFLHIETHPSASQGQVFFFQQGKALLIFKKVTLR